MAHSNETEGDLSATLANSGPLDFPSEKSFLLFFAHEKVCKFFPLPYGLFRGFYKLKSKLVSVTKVIKMD